MKCFCFMLVWPILGSAQSLPDTLTNRLDLRKPSFYREKSFLKKEEASLGEVEWNKVHKTASVSFFVPRDVKKGRIEIFEKATGRVHKFFSTLFPGNGTIEFEIQSLGSGLFGCRLILDEVVYFERELVIS